MLKPLFLLLSFALCSCSYLDDFQKFSNSHAIGSENKVITIFHNSQQCAINDTITVAAAQTISDKAAYIIQTHQQNSSAIFRLFRTHMIAGGYILEGVSYDGTLKANITVNYLATGGTHIFIDEIQHYKKGVIASKLYEFCFEH